jgi:hypothetical protein
VTFFSTKAHVQQLRAPLHEPPLTVSFLPAILARENQVSTYCATKVVLLLLLTAKQEGVAGPQHFPFSPQAILSSGPTVSVRCARRARRSARPKAESQSRAEADANPNRGEVHSLGMHCHPAATPALSYFRGATIPLEAAVAPRWCSGFICYSLFSRWLPIQKPQRRCCTGKAGEPKGECRFYALKEDYL